MAIQFYLPNLENIVVSYFHQVISPPVMSFLFIFKLIILPQNLDLKWNTIHQVTNNISLDLNYILNLGKLNQEYAFFKQVQTQLLLAQHQLP